MSPSEGHQTLGASWSNTVLTANCLKTLSRYREFKMYRTTQSQETDLKEILIRDILSFNQASYAPDVY